MSKRMNWRERRACDLAGWLHRHRAEYPDGWTAEALDATAQWEAARYDGIIVLKEPERTVRGYVNTKMSGGAVRVQSIQYTKRISDPKRSWSDPERVPVSLCGSRSSIAKVLASLGRAGIIELVPRSKPKRYVWPSKRLVFGERVESHDAR